MKLPAKYIQSLRNEFQRLGYVDAASPVSGEPLKKILMVGATLDEAGKLSESDEAYLTGTLREFSEQGVAVAPDFQVSVANIDPRYGGEDFLTGKFSADMVVLCLVYDADSGEKRDAEGFYATSPRHFARNAWHDAVLGTGARALSVVGGPDEINGGDFEVSDGKYRLLRDSFPESLFIREDYKAESTAKVSARERPRYAMAA